MLIAAVIYIENFLTNTNIVFSFKTWERITFVSIMIASKCWDDISCTSKSFQVCTNNKISMKELNLMEMVMLQRLNYRLFIAGELYKTYYYDMKKFWVNISISERGVIIPLSSEKINTLEIPARWSPYAVLGNHISLQFEKITSSNLLSNHVKKIISHDHFPSLLNSSLLSNENKPVEKNNLQTKIFVDDKSYKSKTSEFQNTKQDSEEYQYKEQ